MLKSVIILVFVVFLAIYLLQVANVKIEAQLQHHIKASQRATISSIKSLLFELIYMGFVLAFGFLGDNFGVTSILFVVGALILTLGAFQRNAKIWGNGKENTNIYPGWNN